MGNFFDSIAAKAISVLYDNAIAQTVFYNNVSIPAHVGYLSNPNEKYTTASRASAEIDVRASDVPSPHPYDVVKIGADAWSVISVISGSGYDWKLIIEKDVRKSGKAH
jgi:hypothetical protein